jgi:uncharacterized membrane protein
MFTKAPRTRHRVACGAVETGRVEAFSDGVFAIAITLLILVFGIEEVPHGDLGDELLDIWPSYIAYAASFLTIGIIWVNHHAMFRLFGRVDRMFLLLNVLFLMVVAFIPYPTRIVAAFAQSPADRRDAALLYGITMILMAVLFLAIWFYGSRRLLRADADRREVTGITRSYLPGVPSYATGTLLAFVNPVVSLVVFAALALFYALSSSFFGRDE